MSRIQEVEKSIGELRKQLKNHSLYANLKSIEDVKTFTEYHVFAVWDFMSLLKSLQSHLTCVSIPWLPAKNPIAARFINEIVLEEETDKNELNTPKSHFEMYLDAMKQLNANTNVIDNFINKMHQGYTINDLLDNLNIMEEVKDFIKFTFEVIHTNKPHIIAASFTFGREDVIPDMFIKILSESENNAKDNYSKFLYYLNRHIELDGDDHGPLALNMVKELCGNDSLKWKEVEEYAKLSLKKRIALWNGINNKIIENHLVMN